IAAVGGAAGMLVATAGVRLLVALSPPNLPRLGAIASDRTTFLFAAGITTLIAVALGLVPALQAARTDPHRDLQYGWRPAGGGHRRTRTALVIAEVALAIVLLVSSGLLWRSLERLFAVESGFDASDVVTMQVQVGGHRFEDYWASYRFFNQALDASRRVPGVAS